MSRRLGLPLAASIAGHGCVLILLLLFLGRALPMLHLPAPRRGIEIMLAPAEPIPAPQPPAPPIPPPPVTQPTPPPPPPVIEQKPPPPAPPEHRVVVRPPPRRAPPREPREMVEPRYEPPPQPAYQPPAPAPVYQAAPQIPPQTAAIPRPAAPPRPPGPLISGAYRGELSAWLASHKRYPESAQARGEQGEATLRFRVDRSGRVLSYSLVGSTGYPDLDAAVDAMMRGAVLPPFPADMTASDIEITVPIHFRLER